MEKICVIFGGKSPEHDVSIISGMQCAKYLQNKYDVKKIYLGLDNKFYDATGIDDISYFSDKKNLKLKPLIFYDGLNKKSLGLKKICDIKCVVNCCHGGVGENGCLAGFFSTLGIPFTSASSLAGGITMDKSLTKQLVADIVKVVDGIKVTKQNYVEAVEDIESNFPENIIVKPNALGSSIGVKVCNKSNFKSQIEAIFELNDDALVEEKIEPMIELNQACYKKGDKLIISAIEQPLSKQDFLTFDEKYRHNSKTKVKDRIIPAQIDKDLENQINIATQKIYSKLNLNGVVRIDYMYNTKAKILYFNEVNTVPGSLAFYLFEPIGIDYISLIEDMIDNATQPKKYSYFDTKILTKKLL